MHLIPLRRALEVRSQVGRLLRHGGNTGLKVLDVNGEYRAVHPRFVPKFERLD